jgi:hypothetical protein
LKDLWNILKTLSGSSPFFALPNKTTFGQTQTGATVPLLWTELLPRFDTGVTSSIVFMCFRKFALIEC